jgi:UDP-3-O-[3-hydroxymyristoyl] glucosamine N-acyltransferase
LSCKFIIGNQPELGWAAAAWREVAPALAIVEVLLAGDAAADATALEAALSARGEGDTAFVAGGPAFLNMHRLELMAAVRLRGLAMPPLVCRGATVSANASLGENCHVGAGTVIGAACTIGYNAFIGAGVLVGNGAVIGHSAFLDDGCSIGRSAAIAAHATIGAGVSIAHGVAVGKYSIIDKPGCYTANVAARTFIHASHDRPIMVVGQ